MATHVVIAMQYGPVRGRGAGLHSQGVRVVAPPVGPQVVHALCGTLPRSSRHLASEIARSAAIGEAAQTQSMACD